MNNWIIIITFTYPHEAYLVKGRLESEGIEVMLKDELTTQVNNFYSNAIGGVKLLVQDSDYERAYKILVESGYIKEQITKPNKFLVGFDRISSKLPFIGKSIIEMRLLIVVTLILLMIIVPAVLLSLPSTLEKLTENSWCVEKMYYKGKELTPNSAGLKLESNFDNCSETMSFREDGNVILPGIDSYEIWNKWKFRNDTLYITRNTTESKSIERESIYIGKYSIEIKNDLIKLKSDNLIIIGKAYHFNFSF